MDILTKCSVLEKFLEDLKSYLAAPEPQVVDNRTIEIDTRSLELRMSGNSMSKSELVPGNWPDNILVSIRFGDL